MSTAVPAALEFLTFGIHGSDSAERTLGMYGYSWDLAMRNFLPVLRQLGKVEIVAQPEIRLQECVRRSRAAGNVPVVLAFRPFQDACPVRDALVMSYCFWEFPDIPAEPRRGDPRADWKTMAGQTDMILCGSTATAEAFRKGGVTTPLCVVPPPLPDFWSDPAPVGGSLRGVRALEVSAGEPVAAPPPPAPERRPSRPRRFVHHLASRWLPPVAFDLTRRVLRRFRPSPQGVPAPEEVGRVCDLRGDGVVFTFVFNPDDDRKAWQDLLSAFLIGLRDRPDATLIFKLICQPELQGRAVAAIAAFARTLGGHEPRCRFLVLTGRLSGQQMRDLVGISSWYANATRAEGCCLPLLEAMASGRPGVSPDHTAMRDYVSAHSGLVYECSAEPCALPGDPSGRLRTLWHRACWPSLRGQLVRAYEISKSDPDRYRALASAARGAALAWASEEVVRGRLAEAVARLLAQPAATRAAA
jgi:glycosyltransferase involved in cell wall biosynthesis